MSEHPLIKNRHGALRRLALLWQKEARDNLGAEWAYKNQKPISLKRAAFEKGLALAKQQCADQLAMTMKPPNLKPRGRVEPRGRSREPASVAATRLYAVHAALRG